MGDMQFVASCGLRFAVSFRDPNHHLRVAKHIVKLCRAF